MEKLQNLNLKVHFLSKNIVNSCWDVRMFGCLGVRMFVWLIYKSALKAFFNQEKII